jgi:antitoxin component of MazEF toxin-antitoxin module
MVGSTTRQIIKYGNSRAITLPDEWLKRHPDCKQVHVIFNDLILIFRDNQADKVEILIESIIHETIQHHYKQGENNSRQPCFD